jgi:hypothetical protein
MLPSFLTQPYGHLVSRIDKDHSDGSHAPHRLRPQTLRSLFTLSHAPCLLQPCTHQLHDRILPARYARDVPPRSRTAPQLAPEPCPSPSPACPGGSHICEAPLDSCAAGWPVRSPAPPSRWSRCAAPSPPTRARFASGSARRAPSPRCRWSPGRRRRRVPLRKDRAVPPGGPPRASPWPGR